MIRIERATPIISRADPPSCNVASMPVLLHKRFEVRKARLTPIVIASDLMPRPEVLVATEMSPRGLYIARDLLLPPGERVRVCFRLGTPELWELDAVVVHSMWQRRTGDVGASGLGLELLDPSPLERLKIRALLQKIPPPLPHSCRPREPAADARRRPGRSGGRRSSDPAPSRTGWGTRRLTAAQCLPIVVPARREG